ncbi:MAG: rhamnose utilization protein RhaD (predicted bifunctional aldolase and dehydrogenase) [Verrucomicrobiales bacterium]|jgi:rhamnose utilization protein RhaD (predicted bifunctional aldolase and dehydrogenase)/NAD(P)-dependent dehydrogenase (short-subunit alcohol dehydrogenase family)
MKSLWNSSAARKAGKSLLSQRVYTSRLLGQDPELVLHGGGNTSVKVREKTFFGDTEDIVYVKGSGWDLATIEAAGFSPVRLEVLQKMAEMETLSDADMVREQCAAMTNPNAPAPSIEAILHGILPFTFVDHTHANAVIALTNAPKGKQRIKEVYGDRVLIVPYVMPGFVLSRTVYELIKGRDLSGIEGIVLMNHGIFTFADDAKTSYENMIKLVSEAENFLRKKAGRNYLAKANPQDDPLTLAKLRKAVSQQRGCPVVVKLDQSKEACGYSSLPKIRSIATRGPLTPDHSIRTKRIPVVVTGDPAADVERFASEYSKYFERCASDAHTMLDPSPRWAVWQGHGVAAFGKTVKEAGIISDIAHHTYRTIQQAEKLGGWRALGEKDLFEIEYWELEQAKLKKGSAAAPDLQGKVALVTGAAAGIGQACANALHEAGAAVVALDLNPEIEELFNADDRLGITVNLTKLDKVQAAVAAAVRRFGGIDIVLSNAGIFTAGAYIDQMDAGNWNKSIAVNLTSHQQLLQVCIPFLKEGIDPAAIIIGSRNVAAPGAGAASYSCAKAGLTQLVRVAALELAPSGVRVNIIHPDAVFDTKLWTPEALKRSAERYGLTIEEYKTRNLMKAEITSKDVGRAAVAFAGSTFLKTTGAQIPVDGGNDRVI